MTTTSLPLPTRPGPGLASPGRLHTFVRKLRFLGLRGTGLMLLHRLTGRVSLVRFQVKDLPHPLYLRIGTRDFRDYWRTFEDQELAFDYRPPRVILDGGSGAGLSAVWFATRFPMATVYAVEMERSNFAVLDLNSAPYLNIVPARAAVSGQVGKLLISEPQRGHLGFRLTDGPEGGQTVAGITVGRLLDHYNIEQLDLLKLTIDKDLADEVYADGENWSARVGAIVIDGEEPASLQSLAAAFPVRAQRGHKRHFARFQPLSAL